ncbi:hypothetical protein WA026_017752 [Henosepilachna vigintioctopunctata]|uniref:Uncharacterized protein n=1 Tax=Henosepilachna vigintioctopunctata TaxID=420089 RepID=A0AAW1UBD0_9CUCU
MFNIEDCLRVIKSLVASFISTSNIEDFDRGLKECSLAVRRTNGRLKCSETVGEKQRLLTALNHVKSYRSQLKSIKKKGVGIKDRRDTARDRVHWDDSTSAFESRIRNGIITILKHKDPKDFLVDVKLFSVVECVEKG